MAPENNPYTERVLSDARTAIEHLPKFEYGAALHAVVRDYFFAHKDEVRQHGLAMADVYLFFKQAQEERSVQRVIFICRFCKRLKRSKSVWAHDYPYKQGDSLYRRADGKQIWRSEDRQCPNCHHDTWVTSTLVEGHYTEHPCGAACLNATGPNCDCACGGKNHGKNHL
jgi:hypothetical protein